MLTEEQKRKYEETLEMAIEELERVDRELAAEIARAKEKLQELKAARDAVKLIYDGSLTRLGRQSEPTMAGYDIMDLEKHA